MQFKRIFIQNFQSIKELELVLDENRCYHIKGPNNIGKSAFLKALEAVARNVSSRNVDKLIRDGADSFYIEVSDFNNNVVRLSRGREDYYSWDIDGASGRIDGTAGKVPEEVKAFFNFYEDMEKSKEIVNIRPPRSRLLFIDTTNAENYYLLQKALKIEEYLAAIKLGDSQKREKKKEVQVIIDRIEETNQEIKNLKDYSVILKDLSVYEEAGKQMYEKLEEAESILNLNKEIERKEESIRKNQIVFDREGTKELVEKIKLIDSIIQLEKGIREKESRILEKEKVINEFNEVSKIYKNVLELIETKKLLEDKERLESKVTLVETSISEKKSVIDKFKYVNLKDKLNTLIDANTIVLSGKQLRERLLAHKEKEEAHLLAEKERKDFMVENKFCPVVLSMFDKKCPFSGKTLEELLS